MGFFRVECRPLKILVIGSSGFIGQALIPRLLEVGQQVEAWSRRGGRTEGPLRSVAVDLLNAPALPVPQDGPWDAAFLLAAHAVPGQPWTSDLVMENLRMTSRALDHLADHAPGCRVLFTSSAQVYALAPGQRQETDAVAPLHPYGLSKQLSEDWAQSKRNALDLQIIRPFNQIGPGMPEGLLIPDLLAKLASGSPTIAMRGRDDTKDFLDWRDAMDAYLALLEVQAPSGSVWNLCSGREIRVSALIGELQAAAGDRREVTFADARNEALVGNPSKLMKATGWSARRTLADTSRAIVEASAQGRRANIP